MTFRDVLPMTPKLFFFSRPGQDVSDRQLMYKFAVRTEEFLKDEFPGCFDITRIHEDCTYTRIKRDVISDPKHYDVLITFKARRIGRSKNHLRFPSVPSVVFSSFDQTLLSRYILSMFENYELNPFSCKVTEQIDYKCLKAGVVPLDVVLGHYHAGDLHEIYDLEKITQYCVMAVAHGLYTYYYHATPDATQFIY